MNEMKYDCSENCERLRASKLSMLDDAKVNLGKIIYKRLRIEHTNPVDSKERLVCINAQERVWRDVVRKIEENLQNEIQKIV